MHVEIDLEGHTGYIKDGKEFISITNLLGKFNMGPMDRIIKWGIAKFKNEQEYEQYMTEVSAEGTALHLEIENYLLKKGKGNVGIINFVNKYKPIVLGTEKTVFSKFGVAGTYDALVKIGDEHVLIDWKRSKNANIKHEIQTAFNAVEARATAAWVVTFGGATKQGFSVRKVKNIFDKHKIVEHLSIINNLL